MSFQGKTNQMESGWCGTKCKCCWLKYTYIQHFQVMFLLLFYNSCRWWCVLGTPEAGWGTAAIKEETQRLPWSAPCKTKYSYSCLCCVHQYFCVVVSWCVCVCQGCVGCMFVCERVSVVSVVCVCVCVCVCFHVCMSVLGICVCVYFGDGNPLTLAFWEPDVHKFDEEISCVLDFTYLGSHTPFCPKLVYLYLVGMGLFDNNDKNDHLEVCLWDLCGLSWDKMQWHQNFDGRKLNLEMAARNKVACGSKERLAKSQCGLSTICDTVYDDWLSVCDTVYRDWLSCKGIFWQTFHGWWESQILGNNTSKFHLWCPSYTHMSTVAHSTKFK